MSTVYVVIRAIFFFAVNACNKKIVTSSILVFAVSRTRITAKKIYTT